MGAYGSPEFLNQNNGHFKIVCRSCKMQYDGNFCPYCGTKAGKKKYVSPFAKGTFIFMLGMIAGGLMLFFGIMIGSLLKG